MAALLLVGFWKACDKLIRGFGWFAAGLRAITIFGLVTGAFTYLTGVDILKDAVPLMDAMEVISSVGIVLLGSLPMGEILQRVLRKPMEWLGKRTGMNTASIAGLMLSLVAILPVLALVKNMDRRGKMVCGAFLVCAGSVFAAHLGFTAGVEPAMVTPMILAKLVGGAAGALIALWCTRNMENDA
jgi:ethanolamine transporter